jgi:hypothetical protein
VVGRAVQPVVVWEPPPESEAEVVLLEASPALVVAQRALPVTMEQRPEAAPPVAVLAPVPQLAAEQVPALAQVLPLQQPRQERPDGELSRRTWDNAAECARE